eukprot:scaffold1231_cov107-Cylindrotheca_fusiformis.AAC.3
MDLLYQLMMAHDYKLEIEMDLDWPMLHWPALLFELRSVFPAFPEVDGNKEREGAREGACEEDGSDEADGTILVEDDGDKEDAKDVVGMEEGSWDMEAPKEVVGDNLDFSPAFFKVR